jgi:hypothetical protein
VKEIVPVPLVVCAPSCAYQKNNTHIFGVCEIFLTEDITNDMISIEGFALERKDRSEARHKLGGGLTIYFSDLLNHPRCKDLGSKSSIHD